VNAGHNTIARCQTERAVSVRCHKSHSSALADLNKILASEADVGGTDSQQNSCLSQAYKTALDDA
jgi:hypothetical protein